MYNVVKHNGQAVFDLDSIITELNEDLKKTEYENEKGLLASIAGTVEDMETVSEIIRPDYFIVPNFKNLYSIYQTIYKKNPRKDFDSQQIVAEARARGLPEQFQTVIQDVFDTGAYGNNTLDYARAMRSFRYQLETRAAGLNAEALHTAIQNYQQDIDALENSNIKVVPASEIESRPKKFLIYPYFPIGKVTALYGKAGIGKGFLISAVSAIVSTGKINRLPGKYDTTDVEPQKVLYISSEDDDEDIKEKLIASDADLSLCFPFGSEIVSNANFDITTPKGLKQIRRLVRDTRPKLVVVDPLYGLTGSADTNKGAVVRKAVQELSSIAHDYECAVVALGHPNKGASQCDDIANGLSGSGEFMNTVRSALYVFTDFENESVHVVHVKGNSGRGDSLKFHLENNGEDVPPTFHWDGLSAYTEQILNDAGYHKCRPWEELQAQQNKNYIAQFILDYVHNLTRENIPFPHFFTIDDFLNSTGNDIAVFNKKKPGIVFNSSVVKARLDDAGIRISVNVAKSISDPNSERGQRTIKGYEIDVFDEKRLKSKNWVL